MPTKYIISKHTKKIQKGPDPFCTKKTEILGFRFFCFVIPLGFEPKTHSLEGCCSIQLSYGTIVKAGAKL